MSRIPKWKIDKVKVKVVFRLQFHATNIPSTGWDKLFLSFISVDTGKVTAKTNKANVRNGSCKWPDPIYEATRLLQDSRTKIYDDKLYKLVVAMGTSRSSILGEVDVNLAEFAEALKPASIALPLRGCDCGTVLHVTAQLLTTKTGFREFEQQRETGARSSQQLVNQRGHEPSEFPMASSDVGTDKGAARIKLKERIPLVEDSAGSTEDYDNSSHTSDGFYADKNDPYGGHEIGSFKSTLSSDLPLCSTTQSPITEKLQVKQLSPQGSNDWAHGWSPEFSAGHDLSAAHEEHNHLRTRLEVAESAFAQLKSEATSLQDATGKLGDETQGLSQQLAVELMSRNQLNTEVSLLRTECCNLKRELEEMKSAKHFQHKTDVEVSLKTNAVQENASTRSGNNVLAKDTSIHDLQTEWLQGLLLLENKLQQTRNNALHGLQASDLDFLLADLGALQRVIENLKQGIHIGEMKENLYPDHFVLPSNAAHQGSSGCDHDSHKKTSGSSGSMEEKMCELLQKLEDSKTEKENLLEKMSQMERYYESFIHKLEESQKQTSMELENLRKEHNSCFYTVSVLQAQKQKMHEEMNDQLMRFVEDRTALEAQNKEFERRAVATETALKRVRWNYSAAVDRLQKDLELLSFQVLSMYESNETLAKQSIIEDIECSPEEHSAVADICTNREYGHCRPDDKHGQGPYAVTGSQMFSAGDGMPSNFINKMDSQKNHLQALKIEELCNRSEFRVLSNVDSQGNSSSIEGLKVASSSMEAELLEMYIAKIEWQVFSDVLCESHYTALDIIKRMQGRQHMLEKQLHGSHDAVESLMFKLNSALDQSKCLKESEAGFIMKCDDLTVKNQVLEAKLQDISVENALFIEKLTELERLIQDHKSYEIKYNACMEDRKNFENLLIKESLQTSDLNDELISVRGDFEAMKGELRKQSSLNNDMQIIFISLKEQLSNLCANVIQFSKDIDILGLDEASLQYELQSQNYTSIFASLEFFQQQACQKVLHLSQEKEAVEEMCVVLRRRLDDCESELLDTKQKFQCDLDSTKEKLNFSEEQVETFHQELLDITHKFKTSSEAQGMYSRSNDELTSRLAQMEVQLQHVTTENEVLLEKMKDSAAIVQELERTKVSLAESEHSNRTLIQSLQSKDELLVHMESEINGLQNGEMSTEENFLRDEHKTELIHLRDQIFNLEKANSLMQDIISQSEQIQRDLNCNNCSLQYEICNVQNQLGTVLEDMFSAEVEASYMRSQIKEVAMRLDYFRNDLDKLLLKNKYADELLRVHMSSEAQLTYKNATLRASIHSLEIDLASVIEAKEGLEQLIKRNEKELAQVNTNSRDTAVSADNSETVLKYQDEILKLRSLLTSLEQQFDVLRVMKDEAEILSMVLRSKLEELLQDTGYEITNLREQNKELTHKLAEQTLKAEEFKNLSIHLRELKEKAEVVRKEKEGSLFAMQESLRIAFIKEQYESKVQELKSQVFVSKKYAEEMLLKLQTALDEVETGRKNEIALAKRIEELSMKVSEMEVEMQDLATDKRELSNAYDNIVTELECAKLNFDCCKEEKQKIEVILQECSEERNRTRVELDLVKKLLENIALTENTRSSDNLVSGTPDATSFQLILGDAMFGSASKSVPSTTGVHSGLREDEDIIQSTSSSHSVQWVASRESGDHEHVKCTPSKILENYHKECEASLNNHTADSSIRDIPEEHKKLTVDWNLFQEKLERLKNENLSPLLPLDANIIDPSLSGLERALSQLDVANEHLRRIFPLFKEFPGSGNALERVLALELEMAEALQAKKKTDILFQSSFLKQHNDEAAVFQSFKDINELIQDTIELKRRQMTVECELKDMQGRYSELSVQFAEVEGERQKLEMTLKNRTPGKLQEPYRVNSKKE